LSPPAFGELIGVKDLSTGPVRRVGPPRVSPPLARFELSNAKITVLRSRAQLLFVRICYAQMQSRSAFAPMA